MHGYLPDGASLTEELSNHGADCFDNHCILPFSLHRSTSTACSWWDDGIAHRVLNSVCNVSKNQFLSDIGMIYQVNFT